MIQIISLICLVKILKFHKDFDTKVIDFQQKYLIFSKFHHFKNIDKILFHIKFHFLRQNNKSPSWRTSLGNPSLKSQYSILSEKKLASYYVFNKFCKTSDSSLFDIKSKLAINTSNTWYKNDFKIHIEVGNG